MKTSVYMGGDPTPFVVELAPDEVVAKLEAADPATLVPFPAGVFPAGGWAGRTVYLRPTLVGAVAPYKEPESEE